MGVHIIYRGCIPFCAAGLILPGSAFSDGECVYVLRKVNAIIIVAFSSTSIVE